MGSLQIKLIPTARTFMESICTDFSNIEDAEHFMIKRQVVLIIPFKVTIISKKVTLKRMFLLKSFPIWRKSVIYVQGDKFSGI